MQLLLAQEGFFIVRDGATDLLREIIEGDSIFLDPVFVLSTTTDHFLKFFIANDAFELHISDEHFSGL